MNPDSARQYLATILNKNLRVYTSDGRLFWGSLKCTDPDRNIVLSHTYEYRQPSSREREKAVEEADGASVKVDMTSRYLGLVVIPGHHIAKMEVEQFASQVRDGGFIFLWASAGLAVQTAVAVQDGAASILVFLFLFAIEVAVASCPGATVVQRHVLAREVVSLTPSADVVSASLRQCAGTGGQLGRNDGIGRDPAGESILTVLDNGLASLIAIVGLSGFTRCNGSVVDKLEQVLSVASDNGDLLAVLAESIELVSVGCLDLLACNVGKLGLCNERLGLSSNELLLENNNLGRLRLLVLELSNLISDLLFACCRCQ
ncbi:hypothetical protein HG531_001799 [Fusarium graminearum]|nr:hypothetical protein HG531_001799 [Fusarium graminearum]